MNEKENIRIRIEEEIISTQQKVTDYTELSKPIPPENAIGRISRMDAINNRTINVAALEKEKQKLKNLEIALSKIEDDDFGICRFCKKLIPLGRIMLMPQAITCVNCAR